MYVSSDNLKIIEKPKANQQKRRWLANRCSKLFILLYCFFTSDVQNLWFLKKNFLNFSLKQNSFFGYEYSYFGINNIKGYRTMANKCKKYPSNFPKISQHVRNMDKMVIWRIVVWGGRMYRTSARTRIHIQIDIQNDMIWFYMDVTWLYLDFIWFYLIVVWFYMDSYHFIWILYEIMWYSI